MNIPLNRKACLSHTRLSAPPIKDATAIPIGPSISAVMFDRPAGHRQRLQAEQDGLPVPRPFIAAELDLRSGGTRHVLFIPQGIDKLLSRHLLLRLDGHPVAEIDPAWLQLPQDDLPALTAQLTDRALNRLLRVMLATGASLFAADAQADLAGAIPRLMDICNVPALRPIGRTDIAGRAIISYPDPGISGIADAVAIEEGRLVRIGKLDCLAEGKLLHVLFPAGLFPSETTAFARAPLRLTAPKETQRRLPIASWFQGRGQACKDWLAACVGPAAISNVAPPLLDQLPDVAITIRHLSLASGGLLHALTLADPRRLVHQIVLECDGQQVGLTPVRVPDGTMMLTGLADLQMARPGQMCRILALSHGGNLHKLTDAPVKAFNGEIPDGFEDAWTQGAGDLRPLALARAGFRGAAPDCAVQQFGPARKTALRIVTSIGSSADIIRVRAATIMAEKHDAPVEIVYTMTEGPLALAARQALAQTAAIYEIPHRLVLLPAGITPGERLRAALAEARGMPTLVLGPDILPERPGWLAFWLRRLRRRDALAPVLLACDGAIAAICEGPDRWRGLPEADLPASAHRVRRPLADCLALGTAGITRLLDAGVPHPDAAIWIAAALGGARSETRHPFRRFGPMVPLHGFAAALAEADFSLIERSPG